MIEFALGVLFSPIFFCILFVIAVLFEHNDLTPLTFIFQVAIVGLVWKTFGIDLTSTSYWIIGLSYIPIGLVWATWRWFRHCRKINEEIEESDIKKDNNFDSYQIREWRNQLNVKKQVGRIVTWVLCFPISMVEMFLGDLFDFVRTIVTKFLRGIFDRIAKSTNAKLDEYDKDKK